MIQHTPVDSQIQGSGAASRWLTQQCFQFLTPVLRDLQRVLDRRLVQTVLDLVLVIVMHRHRASGLVLSELGGQLLGANRAPAGVKRIANVVHSVRWSGHQVEQFLWRQAADAVQTLRLAQQETYIIWDESVLEKSESLKAERLSAVRSTKAARLKRIKPGYFNPPGGRPIFVPGFNWLQLLVASMQATNGQKKAKSCEKWRDYGAGKSFISGIVALPAVRGQPLPSIIICVLSCVGTTNTTWLDPMDANRQAGNFSAANVPGTTAWCGMHADVANAKPGSWLFR